MGEGFEECWSNVPEKAMQPTRLKMLEALLRIGRPLSARQLVDVLDGDVSMWEAARHLSALEALDLVEPAEDGTGKEKSDFDVPYRLEGRDADEEG